MDKKDLKNLKDQILLTLHERLDENIISLRQALESSKESRNLETKSSAGDKHETGRAMVQIEMENLANQLEQNLEQKKELNRVHGSENSIQVGFGSVVETDKGIYFMALGIGQVSVGKQEVYCISLASPIGQLLHHKKPGEVIQFNQRKITLRNIG